MQNRAEIAEKLRKWSFEVRIRDGWVCTKCGCLDRELLEAHHIIPKRKDLLREHWFDIDNGETLCLRCHAETKAHKGYPAEILILARLGRILYKRFYDKPELQAG